MSEGNRLFPLAVVLALLGTIQSTGCDVGGRNPKPRSSKPDELMAVETLQPPLVDNDYRFRLSSPDKQWKLLSERDVQRIVPDAVAGLIHAGGLYGVVIVEPLPTADLPSYVELLTANPPLPTSIFTPAEETTFQSRPAIRYQQTATVNGLSVVYDHLVFTRQDHGYQLVSWSLAA